jgi:hypothetical protein
VREPKDPKTKMSAPNRKRRAKLEQERMYTIAPQLTSLLEVNGASAQQHDQAQELLDLTLRQCFPPLDARSATAEVLGACKSAEKMARRWGKKKGKKKKKKKNDFLLFIFLF